MSMSTVAVVAGLQRGWIEFRQIITNVGELIGWLWPSLIALVVMYVLSGSNVPGTTYSLGSQAVPGILGMNVVLIGVMGIAVALTMEREDGTLLRAKATPNGVVGYLVGKVTSRAVMTVAVLAILLVPAAFLFDGLELGRASSWLTLLWVLVLGLLATLPLGAMLGALFRSVQTLGLMTLLIMGLTAISGVFYPLTALPGWLQGIGQVFPVYWLGLGMRSALLPDALAVAEVGGSWRQLETIGVLGAWAVVGLVGAPVLLRRMARRESGSRGPRRDEVDA